MGIFILLLSTLRGCFFLITGLPPTQILLFTSTILIIALILIFSNPIKFYLMDNHTLFKNVIILNVIAGIFWTIIELGFRGFSTGLVREFFLIFYAPLCILIFLKIEYNVLRNCIYFIVLIISISCLLDFWVSNVYPGFPVGTQLKNYYLYKITPPTTDIYEARIGLILRSHGITGSYHDSANILTFCSVFIAGNLFYHKKNKLIESILLVVSLLALMTTFSLANIVACIVGLIIINFSVSKGLFIRSLFTLSIVISLLYFFETYFEISKYVLPQFDPSGGKMQAMLISGESSILENFISLILGHESYTGISDLGYHSEIAYVSLLMNYGILVAIPFFILLTLPIYLYIKSSKKLRNEIFVEVVSISIGVLTLWHYGSLLRSSSIFLFYALYSIFIKKFYLGYLKS